MKERKRLLTGVVIAGIVATAGCASIALKYKHNSSALWAIVSQKCIPGQLKNNDPAPCRQVDVHNGFVVLKDRNGPLQFLLLPTKKIVGIESPELLNPSTPNFFAEAWHSRHFMDERYGERIDDSAIALSINSPTGRTQNQLHIHISCLRPDIRQKLNALDASLTPRWQSLQLVGHDYQVRTVTRDEFKRTSPFIRLAAELPGAHEEMGKYSIAVAALADGRRALLVVKRNLLVLNRASAEELQDHSCQILHPRGAVKS
ncbi:CDP-diacylglycerol diphosphatase [Erwinia tasmaniensis]|uniref:CDP-diacylglycerol diphosphatase n=1 Tax=Erwinia tasmaniensis TaxID=338565 RepID=UPI003A4D2587